MKNGKSVPDISRFVRASSLKGAWMYCSMLYCTEEMSPELKKCPHCLDFIAQNQEELLANLKRMDEAFPDKPSHSGILNSMHP